MFQPGDSVEVKKSRSGYRGPGTIIDAAYSGYYLVQIKIDGAPSLILVRMTDMIHTQSSSHVVNNKKKTKEVQSR